MTNKITHLLNKAGHKIDSVTKPQKPTHEVTKYSNNKNPDKKKPREIDPTSFNLLDDIINIAGGFIIGVLNIPAYLINLIDKPTRIKGEDEKSTYRHPLAKLAVGISLLPVWPFAAAYNAYQTPYDLKNKNEKYILNLVSFEKIQKRWYTNPMPKISFSVPGYSQAANFFLGLTGVARLAFNLIMGFAWGCIKAPLLALQNIFVNRNYTNENIFMQIIKTPFRFASDLLTTPFNTAWDWVHNEARIIYEEREEKISQGVKRALKSNQEKKISLIKQLAYVRAFFGLLGGLIVVTLNLIVSPLHGLSAILNPFGKGLFHLNGLSEIDVLRSFKNGPFPPRSNYNDQLEESLLQWAIKSPFRFIKGVLEYPILIAKKWYEVCTQEHDLDDNKASNPSYEGINHSENEHTISDEEDVSSSDEQTISDEENASSEEEYTSSEQGVFLSNNAHSGLSRSSFHQPKWQNATPRTPNVKASISEGPITAANQSFLNFGSGNNTAYRDSIGASNAYTTTPYRTP